MSKVCSQCGETKPITEFGKDKYRSDGYRGNCKSCKKTPPPKAPPPTEPKTRTQRKNTGKYEALIARYLSGEMYDD